jgi:hypothetical protein
MGCTNSSIEQPNNFEDIPPTPESNNNNKSIDDDDKEFYNCKYYFESIALECEDVGLIYKFYKNIPEPRNIEMILNQFNDSENKFFYKYLQQNNSIIINFKDFVILMYYFVTISNYYGMLYKIIS